jgi:hypothetical protein
LRDSGATACLLQPALARTGEGAEECHAHPSRGKSGAAKEKGEKGGGAVATSALYSRSDDTKRNLRERGVSPPRAATRWKRRRGPARLPVADSAGQSDCSPAAAHVRAVHSASGQGKWGTDRWVPATVQDNGVK